MKRQGYATDLSDAQWEQIKAVLPGAKGGRTGRPRKYELREIWNAIFYQARAGCAWRLLPHDLPPWEVVWEHFGRWRDEGTIERVHEALRQRVRVEQGREATPSAAIVDSQSLRTPQKGGPTGMTFTKRPKGANAISP